MLHKVTHCAGCTSVNTRPHQLCWGDREMGTAISCTECSQVAGLRPSPSACLCILQAIKNWSRGSPGNKARDQKMTETTHMLLNYSTQSCTASNKLHSIWDFCCQELQISSLTTEN